MKHNLYPCALILVPAVLCGLLCPGPAGGLAQVGTATPPVPAAYKIPADVKITTVVAAPNPGGWTTTTETLPIENLLSGGEYEGFNFRTRLYADADGVDTIPVTRSEATGWDSRREGFFDGATARVYRIISGKLVNVRTTTVAKHRASGWGPTVDDKLVPPGQHFFHWNFDYYNSPVAPYYFAVVAVSKDGTWSQPSNTLEVKRPGKCEGKASRDGLKPFARPRAGAGSVVGKAPPAPANFRVSTAPDGVLTFSWDEVSDPDLSGYLVLMSDYPPGRHRGYGYDLTDKAATPDQQIKQGDLVFLDLRRIEWTRNKYTANRVWGDWGNGGMREVFPGQQGENTNHTWALVPHPGPIPPEFTASDRGRTCLKIDMKGNEKISLREYNHAGPGQNWYPVIKVGRPYLVEFWARQEGMATPKVHFGVSGVYEGQIKQDFTLSGEWKKYTYEFSPDTEWPLKNQVVGMMMLSFAGPGTLWLDCWRVYPKDVGYMRLPPADVEALHESGMAFLRTHMFIKSAKSYFLDDLTSAPGVVAYRGNIPAGQFESTLPQVLGFLKVAKVNPWLQVEMCFSEAEWLGLVEYLAAPYDPAKDSPKTKPWAYKRFAMGQVKPWTDEFSKFLFEVSNETWNPLFYPWVFSWQKMTDAATGRVYTHGELTGLMTGYILGQMKKSPYWPALGAKLETAVGGWLNELGDNGFGQGACTVCPDITLDLVANYNGGWDEGAAPAAADDSGRRLALTVAPHYIHGKNNELAQTRDRFAAKGVTFKVGTYEAGPGYALPNTISHEQEEAESQVMKSLAAGTGTLDCFLDGAQQGFVLQNFFTFSRGRNYWSSHADARRGGQAYPSWLALTLYNTQAQGDFLVAQPASLPMDKLDKTKTRPAIEAAPLTGVYATRNGDRYSVFVLSRKLDHFPYAGDDGYQPVTLRLPFSSAKKITLYKMAGDPRATNLDAMNVRIEAQDIPIKAFSPAFVLNGARGADERGLPPAAIFLYVFEGTSTPGMPKNPHGTMGPALDQPRITRYPVVRFLALFDRPLSGLTPDRVKVTGSGGGSVQVERAIELGGTGFLITVSDLEQSGDVGVEIPAGALTDANGAPNAPLTSSMVTYQVRPSQDKLMIQESFDFTNGKTLWTSENESGWKGQWNLHNWPPAKRPDGFAVATGRPLEYPGLASTPNYLEAGVSCQSLWRWLDVEGALSYAKVISKDEKPVPVGLSGTTVWLSFLVRKETNDSNEAVVTLGTGDFYQQELAAVRFGFNGLDKRDVPRVWSLQVRNPENKEWIAIPTEVPIEAGKTVLMVARLTFGKKDSVSLFVNPPLGNQAPVKPSAEYTSDHGRKLSFRGLVIWGGAPGSSAFDEIRFGDSFKAVTPGR